MKIGIRKVIYLIISMLAFKYGFYGIYLGKIWYREDYIFYDASPLSFSIKVSMSILIGVALLVAAIKKNKESKI